MRAASQARNRADVLVVVAALGVGAAGFLTGVRPPAAAVAKRTPEIEGSAPRARSYVELRVERRGDNAGLYGPAALSRVLAGPAPSSSVTREEVLALRRERRAYEGAPPVIPHAAVQQDAPDCLGCHREGGVFEGRVASKISHAAYASCVQCHVVAQDPLVGRPAASIAKNGFVGATLPARAPRAQPLGPPMIPHPTAMRTDCTSCHGALGQAPLRTPHIDRSNCQQCHAPSAALDLRPSREVGP